MTVLTRSGSRLVGVLLGMQLLAANGAAAVEEALRAGTKDVTLAGGYSVSHNPGSRPDLQTVDGFHLIPHFGYVLTDERGPGWLRGNFELLAEPTLIRLEGDGSATVAGLAALARWIFAAGSRVRPYVEAGVGVVGGQTHFRQTECSVNYILQAGPGVLVFVSPRVAVTVGYRFHHLSNGDTCEKNLGLNSSLFVVGVSYFFP